MTMLGIVDYGLGNLASIRNMYKYLGINTTILSNPLDIQQASHIILPGVGAFDNGMRNIHDRGLFEVLNYKALEEKVPILGICLGMQLLSERSEEGGMPGLSWIRGETVRFRFAADSRLKVPHMGWNSATFVKEHALSRGVTPEQRFYFVHSYHVCCADRADVLMVTHYGHDIVAAVQHDNIMGTQFHPEKSHRYGMQLLKNFAEM
jgi:imidazole glycerol-phosphate synthase subunit HisH